MLSINSITKTFHGKKILDQVSLTVQKGSVAVLLGPSGVGKSTLLRVLNNLETPDSGTVTLDGKQLDLAAVNRTHLIGMVFQQFNLFEHLTVEQNITLPLEKTTTTSPENAKNIARALLARYSLADKADQLPSQLSGGQKQRLAIARTIALRPQIICLDEPTSALDPLLTSYIADTIQHLAQEGFTVLIASHDTSLLAKLTCMIYLMGQGKIVESASSQAFKQAPANFPSINAFVAGITYTKA